MIKSLALVSNDTDICGFYLQVVVNCLRLSVASSRGKGFAKKELEIIHRMWHHEMFHISYYGYQQTVPFFCSFGYDFIVLLSLQAFLTPPVFEENTSFEKLPYQQCLILDTSEDAQHTFDKVVKFFFLPLDTLLALLSLTCNAVIPVAVLRTRSFQRPAILLLCSLSMTDLLWAISSTVKNIITLTSENYMRAKGIEGVPQGIKAFCFLITLHNLVIISHDRLLASRKPLWYRIHATRSHSVKKISLLWVLSVILFATAISFAYFPSLENLARPLGFLWYASCILTMVGCYVGVLVANARHARAVDHTGALMRAVLNREKKVANTVGLILIALCFTFLPVPITALALLPMGCSPDVLIHFQPFQHTLITLNGLLNPLLNYGRNEEVRRAVRILIRCQRRNGNVHQDRDNR